MTTSPANVVATPAGNAAPTKETIVQKIEGGLETAEHKVVSFLDWVGGKASTALADVATYLPEAAQIAAIIYPPATAELAPVINFINLAQQAVVTIKQKAAALPAGTTDAQMLADELQLIAPTAIQLLADAGIKADTAYVTKIVNFIVALLDIQPAPATT